MPTCPNCGEPTKKTAAKETPTKMPIHKKKVSPLRAAIGNFIFACFVFLALFSFFDNTGKESNPKPTPPEKERTQAERAADRARKTEECKKDLQCWANRHDSRAIMAAEKMIERMAKHDVRWTDGFMESKFSKLRWANLKDGALTITYIGDKIQFQNGFGAWTNYIYFVDYDTINEKVVDIRLREGRL